MVCILMAAVAALFASASHSSFMKRRMRRVEKIADGRFLLALSGLLAKVAMADGEVTADEVEMVEGFFSKMGLSRAERAMCVGNFLLTQRETQSARKDAETLAATLNHVACLFLYGLLWRVANADWRISEGEERLLVEVGEALGLNDEERARFRAGDGSSLDMAALQDAGVPPALMRLSQAGGGVKDDGLGIWNR